ncbi:hypothetical protein BD310DRAFT_952655 [Dichomitus squalens]|uniref:DUF6533 domain-containing protein n=1 Tax=Dichomitus squalens TaxID=114155 RepID=A0A4Q9PHS3_9APHY|nr:hypothetical protein BD310DRAFT_952655 [Dichomitus squalens]
MSATMTQTRASPSLITSQVPLVAGDVLRAIDTPAVSPPPNSSPPAASPTAPSAKKGHRRTSSAASDIAKAAGIDLDAVSMAEARKVMSEEHKILGFRPPHGSFAAEVQSVAAKHPDRKPGAGPAVDTSKLKEIAREDALRILAERKSSPGTDTAVLPTSSNGAKTPAHGADAKHAAPARHSPPEPGLDLDKISATDARVLMSHEHRALGFRPPPGSLAAEAQAAAARHPDGDGTHLDDGALRAIAVRDAERIKADRELALVGDPAVNISAVDKDAAREIVRAEAGALGHRPPRGSLAAEAQSAGDRHPAGASFNPGRDRGELEGLKERAREEGARLREEVMGSDGQGVVNGASYVDPTLAKDLQQNGAIDEDKADAPAKVDSAVETEPMTEERPRVARTLAAAPLKRQETTDSVEIVGDVLAGHLRVAAVTNHALLRLCGGAAELPPPIPPRSIFKFTFSLPVGSGQASTAGVVTAYLSDISSAREHNMSAASLAADINLVADGANVNRVAQAISFTILYYDFLLTFPQEVERYWTGVRSWASFFFFLNRYMSVVCYVPFAYEFYADMPEPLYHRLLLASTQCVAAVLLMLRTYALYNRNRKVMALLSSMAAIGGAVIVVWLLTTALWGRSSLLSDTSRQWSIASAPWDEHKSPDVSPLVGCDLRISIRQ